MAVHAGRLFYLHVKLQYLCACVKFELRENLKNHFVGLHNYIFHFFLSFQQMFLFLWSFLLVLHRHVKQGRTLLPTSLHLMRMEIMFQKWSKLVIRVTKDSICMNENHRFKAWFWCGKLQKKLLFIYKCSL